MPPSFPHAVFTPEDFVGSTRPGGLTQTENFQKRKRVAIDDEDESPSKRRRNDIAPPPESPPTKGPFCEYGSITNTLGIQPLHIQVLQIHASLMTPSSVPK
jgi:hypothetical protein